MQIPQCRKYARIRLSRCWSYRKWIWMPQNSPGALAVWLCYIPCTVQQQVRVLLESMHPNNFRSVPHRDQSEKLFETGNIIIFLIIIQWKPNPWRQESPNCLERPDQEEVSPKSRLPLSPVRKPTRDTWSGTWKAHAELEISLNLWKAREKLEDSDDLCRYNLINFLLYSKFTHQELM